MTTDRQPNEVKTLYIDRSIWHRGIDVYPVESALVTKIGTQCCLGFFALALGYKKEEVCGVASPWALTRRSSGLPNLFPPPIDGEHWWMTIAMRLNDSIMDESDRERGLTEHFKKIGIDLVFVGETSEQIRLLQEQSAKYHKNMSRAVDAPFIKTV